MTALPLEDWQAEATDGLDLEARYTVDGWGAGIAFWIDGPELVPDEDTEWTGYEAPTGRVLVVMVGDDRRHSVDPEDLTLLDELAYCFECGQVGCTHDGRDREGA